MNEKINYVEFPANDLSATKAFFSQAFGWTFEDFGEEYSAFYGQGLEGGFFQSELSSLTSNGASLIVLLSDNLEQTQAAIEEARGRVCQPIFAFPGGRRFHFIEPSGNELAVWQKNGD